MSPSDLLATPVLNAFQNVALAIIIERQNRLNFSDQCQTKFLLPKSQNEFYDLLTIPSCTSPAKTKAKDMENGIDFPCHYTNSNPHCVLRAIKVLKEDEKHIVVEFRHLQ